MTMKGEVTIYWDTPLLMDKMVKFNKPNIVICNSIEQTAQFIDVIFPQYYKMVSAMANKVTKYKYLKI